MTKRRKIQDLLKLIPTYLSTTFLVVVLFAIIIYVFVTGIPNFNFKLLTGDYEEHLYTVNVSHSEEEFSNPNLEDVYFSENFGIGFKDSKTSDGEKSVIVAYISENSPFYTTNILNSETPETHAIVVGERVDLFMIEDAEGNLVESIGARRGAEKIASALDGQDAYQIRSMQVKSDGGGARGSLITTLYLILITLVIALPIGVCASIFLVLYAKDSKLKHVLTTMIDMTSGIPSIIFGFCGAIIFIPFCDGTFGTNGFSILAGAFTMTLILLPTIIKTTSESLMVIPQHYTMASLALGASKTQTVFKVILPNAIPGILTATILSIGRIIGESAALIFVMGTAIMDDINVTQASTSLALHIWSIMQGEVPNYGQACAISIFILIVVLVLSLIVKLLSKKINKMAVAS